MMKITDKSVGDEQGGFWKGRGCIDQIFAVKRLVENYLEDRKLFAACMDLEKAYDRADRKSLWDTLRVYGMGGKLFEGIRSYEIASASVRVFGVLCERREEKRREGKGREGKGREGKKREGKGNEREARVKAGVKAGVKASRSEGRQE